MNGTAQIIDTHSVEFEYDNFTVIKSYIPLQLAWALTIHKSQGATLDYVITNLSRREIFCHGQAYTALSRVRTLEGLFIEDISKSSIMCDKKVQNYYKSL